MWFADKHWVGGIVLVCI